MADIPPQPNTAGRLRALRLQTGLTSYDVAKHVLGDEDRYHQILKWEAGLHTPRRQTLEKLAAFYGARLIGMTP